MTTRYPIHTDALPDAPLDLQVRHHTARGRKLQSQAMGATLTKLGHALPRALPAMAGWLVRWNQRVLTREALEACSDRTLADIGIPREHIALVAKGVDHRDPIAVSQYGWRPRLASALQQLGFLRPEQRRVRRELESYTDRELNEIGINRGDIPQIARTA
jgi:uncharacterized protein YjiS (DUF1127 family)